jgi:patatin-like phospholipase/acyl hydrolase
MVLAEIERRTGRQVWELFDLVAGTSTGGILALALVKPGPRGGAQYSAADVIQLYQKEGRRIFSGSPLARVLSLGHLTEEKYPAHGIERVLNEYFGEARLKDSLCDVIVTSYETERRFPFFFKSRAAQVREDYDFPMKLVARATSAAPTFFEPLKLAANGLSEYFSLIDGGVYANNPALCGYAEARANFPRRKDVLLVSLGTGELTMPLSYGAARGWGLLGWAKCILGVVLDGVSSTVDYQLQQLLSPSPSGERRYWRFQVRLNQENEAMDDASRWNIRGLKLIGERMIRDRSDDIELLCERLSV